MLLLKVATSWWEALRAARVGLAYKVKTDSQPKKGVTKRSLLIGVIAYVGRVVSAHNVSREPVIALLMYSERV